MLCCCLPFWSRSKQKKAKAKAKARAKAKAKAKDRVKGIPLQPFDEYCESVDTIFEVLEGTVDRYYEKIEKAQKKQPEPLWED